jgi:hypothetical protein
MNTFFCIEFLLIFSMTSTAAQIEAQGSIGLHHSMDKFVGRR